MAIPQSHLGPTPAELDFPTTTLTEANISIVPLITIDRVRLLSGIFGPFRPPQPATVPLWVAIYLKKKKKALLIPPEWMSAEALYETLKIETTQPGFASLPFYWMGISNNILKYAQDDVRDVSKVRSFLKDIREARQSKILAGIEMTNHVHLEMTGISLHEIGELRPFFTTAFNHLKSLRKPTEYAEEKKREAEQDQLFNSVFSGSMALPSIPAMPDNMLESMDSFDVGQSWNESSMRDESLLASADLRIPSTTTAKGRRSNVSDSGYFTSISNTSRPSRSRSAADQSAMSGNDSRPPRFGLDDDDDDDE